MHWRVYAVIFLCPIFLEQIECTNQNVKDALGKYTNEQQEDWDVRLQAIVYGINTAKQVRNILRKPLTSTAVVFGFDVFMFFNNSFKLDIYSRNSILSLFPPTPTNSRGHQSTSHGGHLDHGSRWPRGWAWEGVDSCESPKCRGWDRCGCYQLFHELWHAKFCVLIS